jgi:SAM-dependent methyltransferase
MKNQDGTSPCAVCGQNKPDMFRIWFDGYLKLYRCLQCGFIAQYPGPGYSTIVTDYEDAYSLDFVDQGNEFMYPHRRTTFQDLVYRIIKLNTGKKILDIGCGDGHFLYLCGLKGFDCHGVEDSKDLLSYAASKTGAKIVKGLYSREMFPPESFDIITLIQVLEHIPDPVYALETARYHLRENGILIIEVPSIYAPHFLLYEWTGIKKFVKPPTGVIFSHCGYYSPGSMTTITERCGFKKLNITTGRWQYKYSGLVGLVGKVIDPLLNSLRIGGILYTGIKS